MKTKFYWIALLVSAAMITQANAGGHGGGGGGGGGGGRGGFGGGPRGGFSGHFAAGPGFYGGRSYYGPRFSGYGMRQYSPAFRPGYSGSSRIGANRAFTGSNRVGVNRAFNGSRQFNRSGQFANRNNLSGNWRNHVVEQHSANWHRDWDRGRDHFFHGHRFRFVDGGWFGFDYGFDPWWDWYAYDYYPYYPYGYGYGYGPYGYDPEDDQGQGYYDQNPGDQSRYHNQNVESPVAAVQQRLRQQGYYRGQIDGVFGSATRRAIGSYQNDHGLRVTGSLTTDTLRTLGLRRVASN